VVVELLSGHHVDISDLSEFAVHFGHGGSDRDKGSPGAVHASHDGRPATDLWDRSCQGGAVDERITRCGYSLAVGVRASSSP
jgi:hypothetical protein